MWKVWIQPACHGQGGLQGNWSAWSQRSCTHHRAREVRVAGAAMKRSWSHPGPDRVIDKGILGPGFLSSDRFRAVWQSHALTTASKRSTQPEGLDLSRSVMERSMARCCAEILAPIAGQLRKDVTRTRHPLHRRHGCHRSAAKHWRRIQTGTRLDLPDFGLGSTSTISRSGGQKMARQHF